MYIYCISYGKGFHGDVISLLKLKIVFTKKLSLFIHKSNIKKVFFTGVNFLHTINKSGSDKVVYITKR